MRKIFVLMTVVILVPQYCYAEYPFGKNGFHFRFNFATPVAGPEYIDLIDSGIGFGVDYVRAVGNNLFLKAGFDYMNLGESEYEYRNGYYYWDENAFNFHLLNFSFGMRYLNSKYTPMPFFEVSPGLYSSFLGGNSRNPATYNDTTSAGLNLGGGILIPFYRSGMFEIGARYNIDFIPGADLQFFSFTGGFSYYFRR